MASISGAWQWKEGCASLPLTKEDGNLNFLSNSQEFSSMHDEVGVEYGGTKRCWVRYYDDTVVAYGNSYCDDGQVVWINPQYKIFTINGTQTGVNEDLNRTIQNKAEQLEELSEEKTYTVTGKWLKKVGDAIRKIYKNKQYPIQLKTLPDQIEGIYEAGKQAEQDRFWDSYQKNGGPTSYEAAFAGVGWNNETFKPKHKLIPTYAYNMFYGCGVTDGWEYIKDMDFSQCTFMTQAFVQCHFKHIGIVDCTAAEKVGQLFSHVRELVTIDKIIVNANTTFTGWFDNNQKLENITFEGEIANDLVMGGIYSGKKWGAKLTKESIESIITHLSDATSGKTLTLSKTAVLQAFELQEIEEGWLMGTYRDEWDTLVQSKSNWTVTLYDDTKS